MSVTLLYAGLLGLWFLALTIRVVLGRSGPAGPSLGDGGNPEMLRRIRGHANFAEYTPLVLAMLGFLEFSGEPKWVLHVLGASLLLGRLLHGYALSFTANFPFGRTAGILLTLIALLGASGLCLQRGALGSL